MTGADRYTDEQKQAFVDRAAQIGVAPAMKELGYPAIFATAQRWCKALGVTVELSALQAYAAKTNHWYGANEKLALCQRILDEAYDILINGEKVPRGEEQIKYDDQGTAFLVDDPIRIPVRSAALAHLTGVVQRVIQTMELLEGRVTDRVEAISQDPTDIELAAMIREYRVRNAIVEQEVREIS